MKHNILRAAAPGILAACLVQIASGQDSHWTGAGSDNLWSNPNNWNPVGVPTNQTGLDPVLGGNVWLQPVSGVPANILVGPGDIENPGIGGTHPPYNTVYGPESGSTLTINGTLNFDWTLVPWQRNSAPAQRSHLNMRGNGVMTTSGASLNMGDGWWEDLQGGPYDTMNMYDNSSYSSLGGAGLWLGGHLNIYDNASFLVDGYVNMDVVYANNDATRALVLGGGTLILPEGTITAGNSGSVYDWIARGVLRAYGKGYDTNDLNISDNGTNTIVTPVALGGSLASIHFQALAKPTMTMGMVQQAILSGNYPSVTDVLLSSDEPGIDPASFAAPVYTSSNPGIVSVNANGVLTAVGLGTATISATVGALSTSTPLSVTVVPLSSTLIHRYSFNETSGTTASDSVGGASWNGTLMGTAAFDGAGDVVLDGNANGQNFVQLPAGIVSGMAEVTVEAWASLGVTATNNFENLFAFGASDTDPLDATYGLGGNYITFSPHTGGGTAQANFGQGPAGFHAESDAVSVGVLDGASNMHIVAVYHPYAGVDQLYTNGVLAASGSMFNVLMNQIAVSGSTLTNSTILPYTLGPDPVNYIGKSLYLADPGLLGSINEFRIYNGALSSGQIAADNALGPNQLIGTSTTTTLSAAPAGGGNTTLSWPTNSALVNLLSSPVLGSGAVWTPVSGSLTVSGGRYQITVPTSGNAQFFRLSL